MPGGWRHSSPSRSPGRRWGPACLQRTIGRLSNEVCRGHGVLLIADEVMTGFGRTGAWFASEHWGVRPDLMVLAKGAASGYWPLGLAVASDDVHETIMTGGFTHGFTYSHHGVGAAAGRAVLAVLKRTRSRSGGTGSRRPARRGPARRAREPPSGRRHPRDGAAARDRAGGRPTRRGPPFARSDRVVERVVAAGMARGVLLYSSTGCADGRDGDLVLLGPPLVITEPETDELASLTAAAIRDVLG